MLHFVRGGRSSVGVVERLSAASALRVLENLEGGGGLEPDGRGGFDERRLRRYSPK